MRSKKLFLGLAAVLAVFVISTFTTVPLAAAQTEKVLHSFSSGKDGSAPWAGLTFDTAGNLFGTTTAGGLNSVGTAFKFTPKVGGGYTEKLLHNFNNNGTDGYTPLAGLIGDSSGNLYGTTSAGGTHAGGTVFELVPQSGGGYAERVLYSFLKNGTDGNTPIGGLIIDSGGNLYGTTQNGGSGNHGTVFELSPSTGRTWTETILWTFDGTNGANPRGGVVFDSAGNLYGTTENGGQFKFGTVFELLPSGGHWSGTVLHNFNATSTDVAYPDASLIFDSAGSLYGTASYGGSSGGGGVFEMTVQQFGTSYSVLYFFNDVSGSDGYNSQSPLIFDSAGNLYGTTSSGGSGGCEQVGVVIGCGTIFKLTHLAGNSWSETPVYNFNFASTGNVEGPESGLISDTSGNLYGTTFGGGTLGDGTVFVFKP
jgi:uncharacterized repeat protein (TIGR03803 family)